MAGGVRKERAQEVVLGIKAENGTSPEGDGRTGAPEGEGSGQGGPLLLPECQVPPSGPLGRGESFRLLGAWRRGGELTRCTDCWDVTRGVWNQEDPLQRQAGTAHGHLGHLYV